MLAVGCAQRRPAGDDEQPLLGAVLVVVGKRRLAGLRARRGSRRASRRRASGRAGARRQVKPAGSVRSSSSSPSKRLNDSIAPILPRCASSLQPPPPSRSPCRRPPPRPAPACSSRAAASAGSSSARRRRRSSGAGAAPTASAGAARSRPGTSTTSPSSPAGAGVEWRKGRVVGLFTLYQPLGWRTPKGLELTTPTRGSPASTGRCGRGCGGYSVLTLTRRNAVTAFYVLGDRLWAFGLSRPDVALCR